VVNVVAYKCKTRVSLPTRGRQRKRRKSVKQDVPILHLFCEITMQNNSIVCTHCDCNTFKMLIISLVLDVLCQQGDVDQVDSSPLRPRKDVLTKQYKKKHHGSPIVPPLELYKLQQQDSLPDYAQLSPRERYDGLSTEEALLSPRTRPLTVDTRTIPHECPPSPPHEQVEHSWFERRLV